MYGQSSVHIRSVAHFYCPSRDTHSHRLQYPSAPLLTSGSKKNPKLIPAELCFVAPGNLVKKIDPRLQASVPQLSGKRPTERIGMYDHLMGQLVRGC